MLASGCQARVSQAGLLPQPPPPLPLGLYLWEVNIDVL